MTVEDWAETMCAARVEVGLTVKQLAERMGVPVGTYAGIESAQPRTIGSVSNAEKWARKVAMATGTPWDVMVWAAEEGGA